MEAPSPEKNIKFIANPFAAVIYFSVNGKTNFPPAVRIWHGREQYANQKTFYFGLDSGFGG